MILENIADTLITTVTTWLRNFAYTLLTPIVNIIFSLIPNFGEYVGLLANLFNIMALFSNYILDASLIYQPTLTYIIGSIIFRITISSNTYVGKLLVKWWEALV